MRRFCAWIALMLCVTCLCGSALAAEAPYYTMTETFDGREVYSQSGYLPSGTYREFADKALRRPADLFVDEHDLLYISDQGNKRVIRCATDGETLRVFGEDLLKSPGGIYVRAGKLYVTDSDLNQVIVFDTATGKVVFTLSHPETPLYGVKAAFVPLQVAVDDAGSMYIISKGNTNGIAQFSADGTFLGYFGANDTNLSTLDKLKRLIYTEEQRQQLLRNIPSTPTALDLDARGLVYTVTSGARGVKRLNMAGLNIMGRMNAGFRDAIDVAVGAQETIFVINESGYILEYTRDGRMLFYFGGQDGDRTRTGLFIATVAIDVDSAGNLYVLDRDKALVQRFEQTEYARLVHEALGMYQEGLYAESRDPWEQVLALNSMFDYAQMGLGRAYYKLEMYDEALEASRLGGDKDSYSDAYWEIRNLWLQDAILWIIGGLFGLSLLHKLWKRLKVKWGPAKALAAGMNRVGSVKIISELRFLFYFPRNPADAFYGVKHEGKVSVLSSTILYALTVIIYIVNKYACGFLFKAVQDGQYEVGTDLVVVLGGIALFLIACNLICSIREGEGTFKQMYCGLAYALGPYIVLKPINFLLSFVLTYNEAFIITVLDLLAIAGCLVLIIMMVKTLQNYTFTETFIALALTLFTMLMIVVAGVIAIALIAQLWEFLAAVWKEAIFYYET